MIEHHLKTSKDSITKYNITIDWESEFQQWFSEYMDSRQWSRIVVLTDEQVWRIYGAKIRAALAPLTRPLLPVVLPPGEDSKDFRTLSGLVERLVDNRVHRRELLLCAGGGVCSDIGGLLAMLYMRGIEYVNLPTSLMAQIDAAIGGKVGANFGIRKNLLGGFCHPLLVLIDPGFLETLPDEHFRSALAEAFKVAIILENDILLDLLENKIGALIDRENETLMVLIEQCIRGKLDLLRNDPHEACLDRYLNLGHAVAHSLERLCAMPEGRMPLHGEAVAIGLATVIRYSHWSGICSRDRAVRLIDILVQLGLPQSPGPIDRDQFKDQLSRIAEHRGGLLRLVVPAEQGGVTILPDANLDVLVRCLEPDSDW